MSTTSIVLIFINIVLISTGIYRNSKNGKKNNVNYVLLAISISVIVLKLYGVIE